jgi:signal transduction histidine kinase
VDITERKLSEERALQAERLAAIGEMVTGLAHESRNALQRGHACLEMLALEVPDRPRARDLVVRLQKAQDDLARLYEDVRDYAAPIQLRLRACNLVEVWQSAWMDLGAVREGRVTVLREVIEVEDSRVLIDPFRMGQVFRNLLENALAACHDPVEIEIRCVPDDLNGQPAMKIFVRDNGPGFTPEQGQRVFEAFYTTKTKGTGLGLAICRRIIEAHKGRMFLGDRPGRGAEFILILPRGNP